MYYLLSIIYSSINIYLSNISQIFGNPIRINGVETEGSRGILALHWFSIRKSGIAFLSLLGALITIIQFKGLFQIPTIIIDMIWYDTIRYNTIRFFLSFPYLPFLPFSSEKDMFLNSAASTQEQTVEIMAEIARRSSHIIKEEFIRDLFSAVVNRISH